MFAKQTRLARRLRTPSLKDQISKWKSILAGHKDFPFRILEDVINAPPEFHTGHSLITVPQELVGPEVIGKSGPHAGELFRKSSKALETVSGSVKLINNLYLLEIRHGTPSIEDDTEIRRLCKVGFTPATASASQSLLLVNGGKVWQRQLNLCQLMVSEGITMIQLDGSLTVEEGYEFSESLYLYEPEPGLPSMCMLYGAYWPENNL